MALEIAMVVFRFAHFAACIFAFGASAFCIALPRAPDGDDRREGLRSALRLAAVATVITAILWFQCVAGTMTGNAGSAADLTVLQPLLFKTSFGQIWLWRILVALAVLIVAFRAAPEMRLGTVTLSGLLLASVGLTGHAAMEQGVAGIGHRITDALHLLSGGYWIGAVAALPFLLKPAQRSDLTYRILCRFSELGVIAVLLVVTSGILNALFIVQDWSHVLHFTYGKVLLVKVGLVITMVIVACLNRFILTPTFQEGGSSFRSLRRNVLAETLIGVFVVLAASLLGTVSPPMSSTM
jgi:putative copper resistance protein D